MSLLTVPCKLLIGHDGHDVCTLEAFVIDEHVTKMNDQIFYLVEWAFTYLLSDLLTSIHFRLSTFLRRELENTLEVKTYRYMRYHILFADQIKIRL